jgi:hypothetical protein
MKKHGHEVVRFEDIKVIIIRVISHLFHSITHAFPTYSVVVVVIRMRYLIW